MGCKAITVGDPRRTDLAYGTATALLLLSMLASISWASWAWGERVASFRPLAGTARAGTGR